jgi:hypothetical protein
MDERIADMLADIERQEKLLEHMKNCKFICAECRSPLCYCDLSNFKVYSRKISQKRNKLEKRMEKMDLQVI